MTDLATQRANAQYDNGITRLTHAGMPIRLAEITYGYLLAYRNKAVELGYLPPHTAPIETCDIEILDNAWAFSAEGVNFFRLALNDTDDLAQAQRVSSIRPASMTSEAAATQAGIFAMSTLGDWANQRAAHYEVDAGVFSLRMVMVSYLIGFVSPMTSLTTAYTRPDGGRTFVFELNPEWDELGAVRLDVYDDFWKHVRAEREADADG